MEISKIMFKIGYNTGFGIARDTNKSLDETATEVEELFEMMIEGLIKKYFNK